MEEEILQLRDEVRGYSPGREAANHASMEYPENLYIGLFGRTGCGKTSLINSLKFAASGRLRRSKWLQVASQEKAGGHTMFRKLADLTKSIYVIDNRGLDDPNTEQAIYEIAAQLKGERGYAERVEWQGPSEHGEVDDMDMSAIDLQAGHQISCAVFVFSARHEIETYIEGLPDVINFLHKYQDRRPVAVITQVDVADEGPLDELRASLHDCGVRDIFEVANITDEKPELEEVYQIHLLSLIKKCMANGNDTIAFNHGQREELERLKLKHRRRERDDREAEERRACEEGREEREWSEWENEWWWLE